jgi:Methane oxygenase PmoA
MRRHSIPAVLAILLAAGTGGAQTVEVTVEGGTQDLKNVPVCVPVSVHETFSTFMYAQVSAGGMQLEGQYTTPGIMTEAIPPVAKGQVRRDLHVILPVLKKGESLRLSAKLLKASNAPDVTGFVWTDTKDGDPELVFDTLSGARRRPVMRYMRAAYDSSTPEKRNRTYKVFHHLYDPVGKRYVTNGGHTDPYKDEKKLLYPHHRGLMYAFNKISYGEGLKQTCDTWHAKPGDTHEQHDKVLRQEAGPVLGRHRVLISWHGPTNDVFATEERELTVYNVPGGILVEFASKLMTADGKVRLDGDPQHAGFQFRAANAVAETTAKQTYYLRPDGKGKPGATRNWEPKTKQGPVNLPWDAMSFVLGDQRYTACYLNSPKNPTESRFSERDYGRFGCYFEYDLTKDHPLVVNYRVWLQGGEMTGEQVQALYQEFAQPPRVAVGK